MGFSVTKMAPALIVPSEPTPSGNLPLSFIDHLAQYRIPMVHVYDRGQEPARTIREALARALVPYYPVAGRIVSVDGRLHVACSGEGVVFVEASAEFSLKDVGYLDSEPLMIPTDQLLPTLPPGTDENDLLLVMQVTQFKCGGFSVGAAFHHTVFDGIGAGQFFVALGELSRGLAQPTIKPVWHREGAISSTLKFPAHEVLVEQPMLDFEPHYMDVPLDVINRAKEEFFEETNQTCSVLDVVIAMVWQCRTRAIGLQLRVEEEDELVIVVDTRRLYLSGDDCGSYYGNCLLPLLLKSPSGQIANASSLVEIVKLIKRGKSTLPTQAAQFLKGEVTYMAKWDYAMLFATDWRRLGFYETDYGWGKPSNVVPLFLQSESAGSVALLNPPAPKKGVRLRTRCVVKEHLNAFLEEMNKYTMHACMCVSQCQTSIIMSK